MSFGCKLIAAERATWRDDRKPVDLAFFIAKKFKAFDLSAYGRQILTLRADISRTFAL